MPNTLSNPKFAVQTVNAPDLHEVGGIVSLIASPTVISGKGFSVARQGTGEWNITLNRPMPANADGTPRVHTVSFITAGATAEDITCKVQFVSTSVLRLRTFTGATLADPNAATRGCFSIKYPNVKIPGL